LQHRRFRRGQIARLRIHGNARPADPRRVQLRVRHGVYGHVFRGQHVEQAARKTRLRVILYDGHLARRSRGAPFAMILEMLQRGPDLRPVLKRLRFARQQTVR